MNLSNPSDSLAPSFQHTPLSQVLFQTLQKSDPASIRFDEFMKLALYDSQHGYYASSIGRKIGREGDFYTSVSVGETFGLLLGYAIENQWPAGKPLTLVEQGCHNAQLATDIISGLKERNSPLLADLKYFLYEPTEAKRSDLTAIINRSNLADYLSTISCLDQVEAKSGMFLCNELLDAFPVRRFCWREGEWLELFVVPGSSEPELSEHWAPVQCDSGVERFLQLVEPYYKDWPENYQTEFCQGIDEWLEACSSQLFPDSGSWWIIDYGLSAERYFEPSRRTGTLKCYYEHKTHETATWRPGECDISTHVNYTHLIEMAGALDLTSEIQDQGQFLTLAARDWLMSLEGQVPDKQNQARLKQFQTLTHPSMMGRSFQVVQLKR